MLVNIMNLKVKNVRYRGCDELVDSLKIILLDRLV